MECQFRRGRIIWKEFWCDIRDQNYFKGELTTAAVPSFLELKKFTNLRFVKNSLKTLKEFWHDPDIGTQNLIGMKSRMNMWTFFSWGDWFCSIYTMSWGFWKHLFGIPGVRPVFLKPKLHKKSKNRFKTINYRRYQMVIFSNYFFSYQKSSRKYLIMWTR